MRGFYWKPELNTINYTTVANNFWLVDKNDVVAASGTYTNIYRAKGWNFCNTIGYQHVFPFGLSLEFQMSMGLGKRTFTVVRENSNVIPDIPLPNGGMEMVMSVPTNEWFNNYGFPLNQVDKLGFTSYFRFKVGYALWPRNIRKGK